MKDFIVMLAFIVPLTIVFAFMLRQNIDDFWDEHPALEITCALLTIAVSLGIAAAVQAAIQ